MFSRDHSGRRARSAPTSSDGRTVLPKLVYGVTVGGSAFALMRGQLSWFRSRGWDVTLACSPDEDAQSTVEREQISFYGIPMERKISLLSDIRSLLNWIHLLRRVRPDAINVGTPKAGLLGGLAAWLTRVPRRIYVVRGLRLEGAKGPLFSILWIMERVSTALATDVVVVSHSLGRELLDRKLLSAKKSWLIGQGSSNGVDAPAIEAQAEQVNRLESRRAFGIAPDALCVGFIGRVTKDKGVGILLEAFRSECLSEKIELVVIGSVEDAELGNEIDTLGDRVHVLPWTRHLWGTLPIMDVLCLPTRREGFPNVVLEAASAGIPAVTTRATGAVDSVIDSETGLLVDVDDSVALTKALNKLAADPALLRQLGAAAQKRARHDFVPETIWRGLESLLLGHYEADGLARLDRLNTEEQFSKSMQSAGRVRSHSLPEFFIDKKHANSKRGHP